MALLRRALLLALLTTVLACKPQPPPPLCLADVPQPSISPTPSSPGVLPADVTPAVALPQAPSPGDAGVIRQILDPQATDADVALWPDGTAVVVLARPHAPTRVVGLAPEGYARWQATLPLPPGQGPLRVVAAGPRLAWVLRAQVLRRVDTQGEVLPEEVSATGARLLAGAADGGYLLVTSGEPGLRRGDVRGVTRTPPQLPDLAEATHLEPLAPYGFVLAGLGRQGPWLTRLDGEGRQVWRKPLQPTASKDGSAQILGLAGVTVTAAGELVAALESAGHDGRGQWRLLAMDKNGHPLWQAGVHQTAPAARVLPLGRAAGLLEGGAEGLVLRSVSAPGRAGADGGLTAAVRLGWAGAEAPLGLASLGTGAVVVSRTDGGVVATWLADWPLAVAATDPKTTVDSCRDTEPCTVDAWRAGGGCALVPASAGTPCGVRSTCRKGLCR